MIKESIRKENLLTSKGMFHWKRSAYFGISAYSDWYEN